MLTLTGLEFNPSDPQVQSISIIDIAHALSQQARFAGQIRDFYSVAEHSVMCANIAEFLFHNSDSIESSRIEKLMFLHDAEEAYISDIPTPVKNLIRTMLDPVANKIELTIYKAFGLISPNENEHRIMKIIDTLAFCLEDRDLRNGDQFEKTAPLISNINVLLDLQEEFNVVPLGMDKAKSLFLEKYIQLEFDKQM